MKYLFLLILVLSGSSSHAAPGGGSEGTGGGDICEARIQVIRDDIKSWIDGGGPAGLTLPGAVSVSQYSTKMNAAIASARVQCVKPGDKGYPITIDGTPKACRFDTADAGSLITCDLQTFLDPWVTTETMQYILIHHEYAGIAGLEKPNGDISQYPISNQLSDYLQEKTEKKLSIHPVGSAIPIPQGDFHECYDGNVLAGMKCRDADPSGYFPVTLSEISYYTNNPDDKYAGRNFVRPYEHDVALVWGFSPFRTITTQCLAPSWPKKQGDWLYRSYDENFQLVVHRDQATDSEYRSELTVKSPSGLFKKDLLCD